MQRLSKQIRDLIRGICLVVSLLVIVSPLYAKTPAATIEYQPMTAEGLAAGYPFEAWVVFDISSNPAVPGLALPGGATLRFAFPAAFTPQMAHNPQAVLLYGWQQKAAPVPFTIGLDPQF